MKNFEDFLHSIPMLHTWDGGNTWSTGGFQDYHFKLLEVFFRKSMPSSPVILETGAGNSTIFFLTQNPSKLVSIAPDEALFERIFKYCVEHDIRWDQLEYFAKGSEWVLPMLAQLDNSQKKSEFDFILIDGCHNWPMAFVDLFYCLFMLKKDGYLMIDDVQLHSVKEMAKLLMEQPGYVLEFDMGKSLIFKKTTDQKMLPDWNELPYILRKTDEYSKWKNPFSLKEVG